MVVMNNYIHLTQSEREAIFLQLSHGLSFRQIGVQMGRSYTTIAREVKRNSFPDEEGRREGDRYSPSEAYTLYRKRRELGKRSRLEREQDLARFVTRCLGRGWSPEQIAGRLRLKVPARCLSYETIYRFIYDRERRPLRLWEFLRRGHCHRQRLYGRKAQAVKRLAIPDRVPIERRSKEANERIKVGHFETDLMEGQRSTKAVVSVTTDRKALYVLLDKLESKEAEPRARVLTTSLKALHLKVKTITVDNGAENHDHRILAEGLSCQVFFCHPYHSWEKGTVENTVGLVRQYLPKKTDLTGVNQADLKRIAWELNHRPRKKLGFYMPSEVLFSETGWCA